MVKLMNEDFDNLLTSINNIKHTINENNNNFDMRLNELECRNVKLAETLEKAALILRGADYKV